MIYKRTLLSVIVIETTVKRVGLLSVATWRTKLLFCGFHFPRIKHVSQTPVEKMRSLDLFE